MSGDPDDKKKKKTLINKVLAAVVVFAIPLFVNIILGMIADSGNGKTFNYADCWTKAEVVYNSSKNGKGVPEGGKRLRTKCLVDSKTKEPYDKDNCCKKGDTWYQAVGAGGGDCK